MAKKHSRYQKNIIQNYYQNRQALSLQKLQEQVTELYLAEGNKRKRYWKFIAGHLEKLGVGPTRIEHLIKKDDPALVAKLVEQLMRK